MKHDTRSLKLAFAYVPPVGTIMRVDAQPYRLDSTETYRRKGDGVLSVLLNWRSDCPNCGDSFVTQTGLATNGVTRRCGTCRKTGARVNSGRKRRRVVIEVVEPAGSTAPDSLF